MLRASMDMVSIYRRINKKI